MSGTVSKRRRATTCSYHKSSCGSQSCGAVCSFSALFMRWLVRPPMPRISMRANPPRGCLRTVARRVIAARPVSPGGVPVPSYFSSFKSITRPVRTRRRNSRPIWPPSTPNEAADPGWRQGSPRHPVRRNRRHPLNRIEIAEELSLAAALQQQRIAHDCEAIVAAFRLGTTTRRVNSPLL